jgi:hypothetical protein
LDKTGDSLRTYNSVELSQLELAYAITVHKAQGGEAQHVVLALSPQHGRMLTRRLLYTGALIWQQAHVWYMYHLGRTWHDACCLC